MIGPRYQGCHGKLACEVPDFGGWYNLDYSRHDVSMQVVGQPARDLAHHFVQRCVLMQRLFGKNSTDVAGGITF